MTGVDDQNDGQPAGVTDFLIRTILDGRYRVDALLGRGGMSAVYKAHSLSMDKPVAVKLLLKQLNSEDSLQRFRREARALSLVKHKNLVEVYQLGVTEDGSPYMVIEYLEGESLAGRIARMGALDAQWSCRMMIEVCEGLSAAHAQGILHRDIKPGNIMIVTGGDGIETARVVDFGIAKIEKFDTEGKLTHTGSVLGSPAYMSPEQCLGKPLDARSEVYALGCVLFEMLVGHEPFRSDNLLEVLTQHETAETVMPSSAKVPSSLSNIVYRCLEKQPEHRYATVTDLAADLRNFIDQGKSTATTRRKRRRQLPRVSVLQVASAAAVLIGGALLLPPSRVWLIRSVLPVIGPGALKAALQQELTRTLLSGNRRSVEEAAILETELAATETDLLQRAEHLRRAVQYYTQAGALKEATLVARQRVDCLSHVGSVPMWTAMEDYLNLCQRTLVRLDFADAVHKSMDDLREEIAQPSVAPRDKQALLAVHKRIMDKHLNPTSGQAHNEDIYRGALILQAFGPAFSNDYAQAASNLKKLIDDPSYMTGPTAARQTYPMYFTALRQSSNEQLVAAARAAAKRFAADPEMVCTAREWEAVGWSRRDRPDMVVRVLNPIATYLQADKETREALKLEYFRLMMSAHNDLKQHDKALSDSALAAKLGFRHRIVEEEKARALMAMGDFQQAESVIHAFLEENKDERFPGAGHWFGLLATCQHKLGKDAEACASLERAVSKLSSKAQRRRRDTPEHDTYAAVSALSDLYVRHKSMDKYMQLWKNFNELELSFTQNRNSEILVDSYLRLAEGDRMLGNVDDEVKNLEEALKIRMRAKNVYRRRTCDKLAEALKRAGRIDESARYAKLAATMPPAPDEKKRVHDF